MKFIFERHLAKIVINEWSMPRSARLRPEDKVTLTRAATLKPLDLTGYILRNVLPPAKTDICEAEQLKLSKRDSLRVLQLLENPPPAPARLVPAAKAGFTLP
jgi:uncharacterized protein (DUF1778 family)